MKQLCVNLFFSTTLKGSVSRDFQAFMISSNSQARICGFPNSIFKMLYCALVKIPPSQTFFFQILTNELSIHKYFIFTHFNPVFVSLTVN